MQSWVGLTKSMSRDVVLRRIRLAGLCLLAASTLAIASSKDDKTAASQMVDSGSFGVFMNGHRAATETFSIHQNSSGSSIVSEFKSEAGADKAEQRSEWQMS